MPSYPTYPNEELFQKNLTGSETRSVTASTEASQPNPYPDWLPQKSWLEMLRLSNELEAFKGLPDHLKTNQEPWRKFYDSKNPHETDFPGNWNELR